MSVSSITITIEEFERLIEKEKKLNKIKDLHNVIMRDIKETNMLVVEKMVAGDKEAFDELLNKQTLKNIDYIGGINHILGE